MISIEWTRPRLMCARASYERVERERLELLVEDDLADRWIERSGLDGGARGAEDHVEVRPATPPLTELKAGHDEKIGPWDTLH